jgi:hypothetical protein
LTFKLETEREREGERERERGRERGRVIKVEFSCHEAAVTQKMC